MWRLQARSVLNTRLDQTWSALDGVLPFPADSQYGQSLKPCRYITCNGDRDSQGLRQQMSSSHRDEGTRTIEVFGRS